MIGPVDALATRGGGSVRALAGLESPDSQREPRSRCMTMRAVLRQGLIVFVGALGAFMGCGDDEDGRVRGDAVCSGTECQCPGTGDCEIECRGDCDLACTGSGDCAFSCGAQCEAACPGSGACIVDVGGASSVSCSGSGGCDVTCRGDCTVDCPGSGPCTVRCAAGSDCELTRCEDVVTCSDGIQVCNGACPEA